MVVMEAAAMAVVIMVVMAAAMAVAIMVVMEAAAMAVAIMVVMEAVIMDLIALTLINPLEQKVGKTEAMEILLIILNMKMVGVEEKGACPMRAMLQTRQINNPFL
jgi:hypothetical protein